MKIISNVKIGKKLLKGLLAGIAAILLLHMVAQWAVLFIAPDNLLMIDVARRFHVDMELNVPTWFASVQALIAGGLALLIGMWQRRPGARILWYAIGAALVLLSLDEAASLHELLLQGIHIKAQFGEGQSFFANAWLVLLPFIVAALLIIIVLAERHLPLKTFRRYVVAGAVYLLGALIVEYISIETDKTAFRYNLIFTPIEEGAEFLGVWLLVRAQLLHIQENHPRMVTRLKRLGDG